MQAIFSRRNVISRCLKSNFVKRYRVLAANYDNMTAGTGRLYDKGRGGSCRGFGLGCCPWLGFGPSYFFGRVRSRAICQKCVEKCQCEGE